MRYFIIFLLLYPSYLTKSQTDLAVHPKLYLSIVLAVGQAQSGTNTSKVGVKKSQCTQPGKVGVHFSGKIGVHRKIGVNGPKFTRNTEKLRQKLQRLFLVFSVMENSGTVLRDFQNYLHVNYKYRSI